MLNAATLVDAILETGDEFSDEMMKDFVTQSLAVTDPLIGLDSHHIMSTGIIEAWHRKTGKYWKGRIQFTYDPRNGDFAVNSTLEAHDWHQAVQHNWPTGVQASSFWGINKEHRPLMDQAIKALIKQFDPLTDMPPDKGSSEAKNVKAALEQAMLVLDDVMYGQVRI